MYSFGPPGQASTLVRPLTEDVSLPSVSLSLHSRGLVVGVKEVLVYLWDLNVETLAWHCPMQLKINVVLMFCTFVLILSITDKQTFPLCHVSAVLLLEAFSSHWWFGFESPPLENEFPSASAAHHPIIPTSSLSSNDFGVFWIGSSVTELLSRNVIITLGGQNLDHAWYHLFETCRMYTTEMKTGSHDILGNSNVWKRTKEDKCHREIDVSFQRRRNVNAWAEAKIHVD